MWPKPLPNHWVQGNTIGVSVDSRDHIWIIHRAECCKPAPAVLEFDEEGNLLTSDGGRGVQCCSSNA